MAQRRLFSLSIVDSDAFLDMPTSAQNLYFHFGMRADDDGFIGNPKKILKITGGADDDLRLLFAKRFILPFENGVIVIKHWRIHNTIRKDRYIETKYLEEKSLLSIKSNEAYTEKTKWQPDGNQMATQVKLSKDKLSIDIHLSSKNSLTPCTEDELIKVRKDLEINIDYVKNKHGGIMDLIESGEFQERYPKNKTVYNTLRQWLRSDLQKGYVKKESKFKITPY